NMIDNPQSSQHPDDEPIVPIEFTPVAAHRRGEGWRPSRAQLAVGGALLLFGAAAWFVLTARSVFFDVRPLHGTVDVSGALALQLGPRYLMRSGPADVTVQAEGYYDYSG